MKLNEVKDFLRDGRISVVVASRDGDELGHKFCTPEQFADLFNGKDEKYYIYNLNSYRVKKNKDGTLKSVMFRDKKYYL